MKQNERLLIYAVSGFLALILVVAVIFGQGPTSDGGGAQPLTENSGRAPAPIGASNGALGLSEILDGNASSGAKPGAEGTGNAQSNAAESRTGVPGPEVVSGERLAGGGQPLVAVSKPLVAAEVVSQALGPNRRERNVRFVRARSGDSLELLVRRWCGSRDPFLAEAASLNEDLVTLRVGQEVAVPYVDDEALMATLEAPKSEVVNASVAGSASQPAGASAAELSSLLGVRVPGTAGIPGTAVPGAPVVNATAPRPEPPTFAVPGSETAGRAPVEASVGRGTPYTVKSGDSLWKISERTYGRQQADRMIGMIKAANPGLTDTVRIGQKIVLPKAQ